MIAEIPTRCSLGMIILDFEKKLVEEGRTRPVSAIYAVLCIYINIQVFSNSQLCIHSWNQCWLNKNNTIQTDKFYHLTEGFFFF